MQGPYEAGSAASPFAPTAESWESRHGLVRGTRYSVAKAFSDADGDVHHIGDKWKFLGATFSKFDDEVVISISREDGKDWKIPLIWKSQKQAEIIEQILTYITPEQVNLRR
jgi:hypothetical protein